MKSVVLAVFVLAIGFAFFELGLARNQLADPLQVKAPQALDVPRGATALGVLQQLTERGWAVDLPPTFMLQLALRVYPEWAQLRAGHYAVYPGDSVLSLARRIRSGEVLTFRVTAIEGLRSRDLLKTLREHPAVVDDLPGLDPDAVMAEINPGWGRAEGAFLPETYQFPWGVPLSRVLRQFHSALQQSLHEAWIACENAGCGLNTPAELLVLASIIEKETGVAAERGEISGVFHRRLKKGMRLQTDPTVIYGLGDAFDGNLTRKHLRTDTPWNTYTRHGLPPTPICLPGRDSLMAAAQPKSGSSLYFVATGKGAHVFSDTLAEHQRAVRTYQLRRRTP